VVSLVNSCLCNKAAGSYPPCTVAYCNFVAR